MCLGIPGRVVEIDAARPQATIDVAGARRVVDMSLLDDVALGDWIVVHLGFALSKIDPEEARAALALLEIEESPGRAAL